ncbi:hypothetical protein [Phocaeicola sp.]
MSTVNLKFDSRRVLFYELGLYIKRLLKYSGISLRQLCKRIHISSKTYEVLITGVELRLSMYMRVIWGLLPEYAVEEHEKIVRNFYLFCLKGMMRGMIIGYY